MEGWLPKPLVLHALCSAAYVLLHYAMHEAMCLPPSAAPAAAAALPYALLAVCRTIQRVHSLLDNLPHVHLAHVWLARHLNLSRTLIYLTSRLQRMFMAASSLTRYLNT